MRALIHRAAITGLAATALLIGTAPRSSADFLFVSESAVFHRATGEVHFTIEFSQPPDFFTVDSVGRPANSFQYEIFLDRSAHTLEERFDTVIRGDEIHITGNSIRIRDIVPLDPDPAAGGWGPIRGSVPFHLDGNILAFSAPLSLVSDISTDGHFEYVLSSGEFGATPNSVFSRSTVVPEPTTSFFLAVGGVMLLLGSCWARGRLGRIRPPITNTARASIANDGMTC